MGNFGKFIKATGNCRIMLDKVRHAYQQTLTREYFMRELTTGVINKYSAEPNKLVYNKDENGRDFITLEQLGEQVLNNRNMQGFLDNNIIWDLYQLYESMSLNGMDLFQSEMRLEFPKFYKCNKTVEEKMKEAEEVNRSHLRKMTEGNRVTIKGSMPDDRTMFCKYDEIVNHFNQYSMTEIDKFYENQLQLLKQTRDDAFTWSVETLLY